MDWLGDWLKQVILIILLAAFVDLLLPNQAMQRYVKTVVSLFLLLTLLTPVFSFFQKGWDAEKLIAEAERMQVRTSELASKGGKGGNGGGKLTSLEGILAQSERMKADNQSEAVKLAEAQLADEMKTGLERTTGSMVQAIEADINVDNQGKPAIGSVRVTLLHKESQGVEKEGMAQGGQAGRVEVQVEEVKPVTVQIKQEPSAQAAGAAKKTDTVAAGSTGSTEATGYSGEQYSDAVRFFREEWQIPADRLEIRIVS